MPLPKSMILLFLICCLPIAVAQGNETENKQPNVLFIFSDDQSYEMVQELWQTEAKTPNLDRLAREGVTFTHAYNMGAWNGAVCIASRTMLNTGRTVWHAQELVKKSGKKKANLPIHESAKRGEFWSQLMERAGYETYMSGKWHIQADATKVFQRTNHIRPGMPNQTKAGYNRPIEGQPDVWSPSDPKFEGFWKGGKHWSEVLAHDATEFIGQATKNDKPFFMYLAFNAPHDPRQSPQKFVDMYPREDVKVPVNFQTDYPYAESIGCGPKLRDARLAPFPRTPYSVKVNRQEYFALITHMDQQIGKILKALDESGEAENTYVIFTSDHGLACGHHGLMGKQNMYDHSVRVPFMIVGPDIPSGKRIETEIYLQDVMPTTLELAGADKPDYVEFRSLLPVIRGERDRQYDAIYGSYLASKQRMIRKDGWKLIVYPEAEAVRLYHVEKDPFEQNDLAGEAAQADRIKELLRELVQLQNQFDDPLDLESKFSKWIR